MRHRKLTIIKSVKEEAYPLPKQHALKIVSTKKARKAA